MAGALVKAGIQVDVACTDDDGPGLRIAPGQPASPIQHKKGFRVFYFPKQTEFYKTSLPLLRWLLIHARDYDVIHLHAVFSFSTLAGALAAHLSRVPYLVRPLGVLNTWGMKHRRRWIKALSFRWLDRPLLNRAAALHYTSEQEAHEAAPLGLKPKAVILPLGLDLSSLQALPSADSLNDWLPSTKDHQVLLFLSRLDEKKGLDRLLSAFASIHRTRPQTVLLIAGTGAPTLEASLQQQAQQLGIASAVHWLGHVSGEHKRQLLGGADLFVLPSRSENFGIALLEAMAAGLPCVTTHGVALANEPNCRDAVIRVPVDASTEFAAECLALLDDPPRLMSLAAKGRAASADYKLEVMTAQLHRLYASINHSTHER
jgi:glycosyltransferase involved in cell wall biosynthesis